MSSPVSAIVVVMLTLIGSEAVQTTLHLWTDGRSLSDVRILHNQRVCLDEVGKGDGHFGLEQMRKPSIYKTHKPLQKNVTMPKGKYYQYRGRVLYSDLDESLT